VAADRAVVVVVHAVVAAADRAVVVVVHAVVAAADRTVAAAADVGSPINIGSSD
jgi:hypothetical protein